jgi:hypothetical protein
MSKARIGDDVPAEMTEGHEVETVFDDNVNARASEAQPDGLENLRNAYQEFWSETHPSISTPVSADPEVENPAISIEPEAKQPTKSSGVHKHRRGLSRRAVSKVRRITKKKARDSDRLLRRRFGLPENFVPRIQRFGRSVLLELNFYRLPNGQEFLPCLPTGPLGSRHLYALLTIEQYLQASRGSVYVRNDGRIFDYSVVSAISLGDMFDTGYTIYDLERTGQYAPTRVASKQVAGAVRKSPRKRAKKIRQKRYRRAAAAG